jgi:hypothetical protein
MKWSVKVAWASGTSTLGMWQEAQRLVPTLHVFAETCNVEPFSPEWQAKALCIVRAQLMHQALMRIVTGDTGDAGIHTRAPAATHLQAVRLKTHLRGTHVCRHAHRHIRPGAMARAAEVYRIGCRQVLGIHDRRGAILIVMVSHGGHVFGSRPMARFTHHPWNRFVRVEDSSSHRFAGVALEAAGCRLVVQFLS